MPDIMKMGKNPNYLGSWDLDDLPNREATLTISRIVDEKVVTNGKEELCTVCYWTNPAFNPMILNITNKKMVCKLYKTKETEKLVGKSVVVGIDQVKAFGDVHDALRIRKRIPKVNTAVKCTDCGNDIQGTPERSAEYIAAYTAKKYKVPLCFDCAAKRQAEKEQKEVSENAPAETDG